MSRRGAAIAAAALAAVLVAAVFVGRWERSRWVQSQIHGMERIRAAIGPLDSRSLIGYRLLPAFDCLVYRRPDNPYALELCVDDAGRVVEAVDRRHGRTYYSLQAEPTASTFRIDRRVFDHVLQKMVVRP